MKKIIYIIVALLLFVPLTGCSSADSSAEESTTVEESSEEYVPIENIYGDVITIEIKVKDFGEITAELYLEEAPVTVDNFVSKVETGFYDGLTIHRVVPGFVIQGGRDLNAADLEPIKGEFSSNGITNRIPHQKGVLSMARKTGDNNSATSQFFICCDSSDVISQSLDGKYAAFGCVISGIEVVDLIATVNRDIYDKPLKDVVIEYIKVVSTSIDYSEET